MTKAGGVMTQAAKPSPGAALWLTRRHHGEIATHTVTSRAALGPTATSVYLDSHTFGHNPKVIASYPLNGFSDGLFSSHFDDTGEGVQGIGYRPAAKAVAAFAGCIHTVMQPFGSASLSKWEVRWLSAKLQCQGILSVNPISRVCEHCILYHPVTGLGLLYGQLF